MRKILPLSVRIAFFALALILLIAAGIFWISKVWGDSTITLSTIFSIVGVILALIALLPIVFPSHDAQPQPALSSSSPQPVQIYVNQFQAVPSQPPSSATSNVSDEEVKEAHEHVATADQVPPRVPQHTLPEANMMGNVPTTHSSTLQSEEEDIDRDALLDRLSSSPSGVFSLVISYFHPPRGVLSGDKASQPERAGELIAWAEHPDGPGLLALHNAYLRAIGRPPIGKKKPSKD